MNNEQRKKMKDFYNDYEYLKSRMLMLELLKDGYFKDDFNDEEYKNFAYIYSMLNMFNEKIKEKQSNTGLAKYINCMHEICLDLGEGVSKNNNSVVRRFKCLDCAKDIEFKLDDEKGITEFINNSRVILPSDVMSTSYYLKEHFNDLMNDNLSCEDVKKNAINRYRYRSKDYNYNSYNN